ncbi:MAG TPA: hypothetical protein VJX67_21020 [Blastocatellia bacterium]|nr:hypothetical protein [Blastocatellia bacterium]
MNIASKIKKMSHRSLITAVALTALFTAVLVFNGSLISRSHVHASKTASVQLGDDSIQSTGYPVVGSRVLFFLDSGPNIGKARPAIVLRAHQSDSGPGQAVDLVVFETPDDIAPQADHSDGDGDGTWFLPSVHPSPTETILFAERSTGVRQPGSWDWAAPSSTGE